MKVFLFAPFLLTLGSLLGFFTPWYMNDPSVALLPHYLGLFGMMILWPFILILLNKGINNRKTNPTVYHSSLTAAVLQAGLYLVWLSGLNHGYTISF